GAATRRVSRCNTDLWSTASRKRQRRRAPSLALREMGTSGPGPRPPPFKPGGPGAPGRLTTSNARVEGVGIAEAAVRIRDRDRRPDGHRVDVITPGRGSVAERAEVRGRVRHADVRLKCLAAVRGPGVVQVGERRARVVAPVVEERVDEAV